MKATTSKEKALYVADLALSKKAQDVVILDMHNLGTFCDYFIICSGSSHRMVKALGEHIKEGLKKEDIPTGHAEGVKESDWVLIDCGDVIAHIFYEEVRSFYNLEWLWSDAEKIEVR